jgi:phosphohistidine phosphatase SixA
MNVTNLRCEYRSNPLGIDVLAPRLSWVLVSDRRGARQTAYQIQAASGEAEGVTSLRREPEAAVYKVTSGVYDFSVKGGA